MAINIVYSKYLPFCASCSYAKQQQQPRFWNLPNELTVKIWGMCSSQEQLKMRQICRQWKLMHKRFFVTQSKVLSLRLASSQSSLFLYGRKTKCEKLITLPHSWRELERFFMLTEIIFDESEHNSGAVILEDEAANDAVLKLIMRQNWNIRRLELSGNLLNIGNETMCHFMRLQNQNPNLCDIEVYRIKNGIVNIGFISDHLIKEFSRNKVDFDIRLDEACVACLSRTSISNYVLHSILRPNMRYRFQYPLACKVTIPGIKYALENFFATDWEAQGVSTSLFTADIGVVKTEKGFYSCELELHRNTYINLISIASIEIDGIEKRCFCKCGENLVIERLEVTNPKRGRVYFVRRQNHQFIVAKISIS